MGQYGVDKGKIMFREELGIHGRQGVSVVLEGPKLLLCPSHSDLASFLTYRN